MVLHRSRKPGGLLARAGSTPVSGVTSKLRQMIIQNSELLLNRIGNNPVPH